MRAQPQVSEELAPRPLAPSSWEPLERVAEGATSVVWRAKHAASGQIAALKLAKASSEGLAREAALLARVARRWGPALLDAGPSFLVTEWVQGRPLSSRDDAAPRDRERMAVVVAHAVGRALEELHEAGVRHGDVKPANVLMLPRHPERDAADDRGATLIDLGLATALGHAAIGGTPRYAAPEVRERGQAGRPADLWALGILLAEILDPRIARAPDPAKLVSAGRAGTAGEPSRWAQALVGVAPGGRPSAAWLAARAARWLGLREDSVEAGRARVERVRRSYLLERERDIRPGVPLSPAITGPARDWLQGAVDWAGRVPEGSRQAGEAGAIEPMGAMRCARWLVSLVGPSAASWPLGVAGQGEAELAARAVELARSQDPSSWTVEEVMGRGRARSRPWAIGEGDDRVASLVRELARSSPAKEALDIAEDDVAAGRAPTTLVLQVASTLLRKGDPGRAWVALATANGGEVDALKAEIARRRGDADEADRSATAAIGSGQGPWRAKAQATRARMAWDSGDLDEAQARLEDAHGAAAAEVAALIALRRGEHERGLRLVEQAFAEPHDVDAEARLESVRGLLEWTRGSAASALRSFGRAVELAARAGAVVDEATYLTSEAAAAADAGEISRALASATRAALLWERLGRPAQAARAWLDRASVLATLGDVHAADEAAHEARSRGLQCGDLQAAAFARLAQVEARPPGDDAARVWAIEAEQDLLDSGVDEQARVAARLLVWAPDRIDDARIRRVDAVVAKLPPVTRWEWWGARATAMLAGRATEADGAVLAALSALADTQAPLGARGPALDAAARLATERGDGDAARRFERKRIAAARILRDGTPPEHLDSLASVPWARASAAESIGVEFEPAQVAQLESIVRALSQRDRLRPLLEQVLDTMILWTGVERGLLLLRAPDGRLVPRAARNLARRDLTGEQLELSQTIARRALEAGDAVVATDAFATLGDVHASVHALKLRSVLALPLVARGEGLGVVYLDDRGRKGAFGARELAWVRVVASQAAMAIADARDAVLLRRAVRRAERSRARVESMLREREAELDVTRTQLELVRDARETRFAYDEIAGRSEAMRGLLHTLDRVTASDVPVLVVGESGTGKELVARAMHMNGGRARRAFVSENCASVPETLLESTLFGHAKGAFTGASSTRAGLFDVANGGTLFLDEIGEMSLTMQAKLLRVLQDGEVRPVGSERVHTVDVRIVAATHRDLEAMVAAGGFREDLFYRLNVISLRVPPLRERREDIPLLVAHFVRKHAPDRPVKVTRAAMIKLTNFSWPGNVRQLENEVRRALVLNDETIDVAELSADVVRGGPSAARGAGFDLRTRVDTLEIELVQEALVKTRGNYTRAAELLGISRFGLQKMMKRLEIKPKPG